MMPISNTIFLRFAVIVIMLMHSIPGMFNNGISDFGNLYLNEVGFAPYGPILAWIIKISHILTAIALVIQRYVKIMSIFTIIILLAGIYMVHYPEGWYVVGGGRNGVEFNFLLIFIFMTFIFPDGLRKK